MKNNYGFFQEFLSGVFTRNRKVKNFEDDRGLISLCETLLSEKGEISSINIANIIINKYGTSSEDVKSDFFNKLSSDFDLTVEDVIKASNAYLEDNSPENLSVLRNASEPRRVELFRRLNQVPLATEKLVRMREDLIPLIKGNLDFNKCDSDMKHLFFSWFNRGFLVLREIDWSTPADILEKIISYEAVHQISDWDDLRRRLQPSDRRCFSFFHPSMPTEPLIFVEVALCNGIASSIQDLLEEDRVQIEEVEADAAIFYSISNCQKGLKGVSFGNILIKQVAQQLSSTLPNLKNFVTLSPMPNFTSWLTQECKLDTDKEVTSLYRKILSMGKADFINAPPELESAILDVAAHYFLNAKRDDLQPVDAVTRFHLNNGASVKQINWLADTSNKGIKQSAGLMVNYLYDLPLVESLHESYAHDFNISADKQILTRAKNIGISSEKSN